MPRILPPIAFLITAISMAGAHAAWTHALRVQDPYRWLGLPLVLGGLALSVVSKRHFVRRGTNVHTFREPDRLVTDGPFAATRNPMYLGFALALLGIAVVLGTPPGLLGVVLFVVLTDRAYIAHEERVLEAKFDAEYRAYASRTHRWW